jgi:hypothetical protein
MCSPILADVKRIDVIVDLDHLNKLVNLASDMDSQAHFKVLRQYLILLLCPPSPFVNSTVEAIKFGDGILEKLKQPAWAVVTNKDLKIKNEMQMILALIAVSHPEFAGKLYDQKVLLEDLLLADKDSQDQTVAKKK